MTGGTGPILLVGATGLVGSALARILPPEQLVCLGRRPVEGLATGARQIVAPLEAWPDEAAKVSPAIAISTLGTTIRKAGSRDAFKAIDLDLVLAVAKAARAAGATQFLMVSSVGAAASAPNFYLSIKGAAEDAVSALGFDRVDILRPGLLRGERNERRLGEQAAIMVSPVLDLFLQGPLARYSSIAASDVAKALKGLCRTEGGGVHVHENRAMMALAKAG